MIKPNPRIVFAVGIAALAATALFKLLQIPVPRSVLIFDPVLLTMIMGGSRFAYRIWKERTLTSLTDGQREPVVVIGAEEAAVTLLKDLARSAQRRVAAVFDDDAAKIGRQLQGVSVVAPIRDVSQYVARLGAQHAIIAMPAASHNARRRAVEICRNAGLKVMTVPSYDDLVSGKVTVSQIRHVELDDLLGRDPVVLDTAGLKDWINGRAIMVTGAGGSIGAELAAKLRALPPDNCCSLSSTSSLYTVSSRNSAKVTRLSRWCARSATSRTPRASQISCVPTGRPWYSTPPPTSTCR